MQPHILTILDDSVYEELQLVATAGLHIADNGLVSKPVPAATLPNISHFTEAEIEQILDTGGSSLSISDSLAW